MADATVLPTLKFFQWQRPDTKPKLSAPLNEADQTAYFTVAPHDENGAVITDPFLFGVRQADGYVETIYAPNGADGASGLSATGLIRGVRLTGLDYTTGDTDLDVDHFEGEEVFCNITGVFEALLQAVIQGNIATGGSNLVVGIDAAGTVTISRSTGAGTHVGWIRWNTTNSMAQFSNDGAVWTNISDTVASSLVDVSATDDTPGYLDDKIVVDTNTMSKSIVGGGGNETLQLTANGNLADMIADVTATATEINQALAGIGASVTQANLDTLTGGAASNADPLHTHQNIGSFNMTAGEAINGSVTPQAIAIAGSNFKKALRTETATDALAFGSVPANVSMGNADATTRQAQSFTYTDADADTITLEKIGLMITKAAAPTDNIYVEIHTDDGDPSPDNSVITNGTSNTVAGTSITTAGSYRMVTFTFATPPTLTSGQKYWIVFRRSGANDGTNYYNWARHGSDIYSSHGQSSYTASTQTWLSENANDLYFDMRLNLDYGGKAFLADANNLSRCKFVGFTESNVAASGTVVIQPANVLSFTSMDAADTYYVGTNPGTIVSTPSGAVNNCVVPVGVGLPSNQLFIERGLRVAQAFYDDLWLQSGGDATSYDLFTELGFKPHFIKITASIADGANNYVAGTYEWVFTSVAPGFTLEDLDANLRTINAQSIANGGSGGGGGTSGLGTNASDYVTVQAVYENGFDLRVVANSTNFRVLSLRITAYGY